MKKKILPVAAAILACAGAPAFCQTLAGSDLVKKGEGEFQQGQYAAALADFTAAAADPAYAAREGDASYWAALSDMALNKLDDAQKSLEFFLMNYSGSAYIPEATYQKGRLLYLQGKYDEAIQELYAFVQAYGGSPFVANAYYWIGECLYALGHFEQAQEVFQVVIDRYPASFKVEASRYRVALIDMQNRETELLKLLNWSHEQALEAQDQFQERERTYEEALLAYQRKIADLAAGKVQPPAAAGGAAQSKDEQIASLKEAVSELQSEIAALIRELQSSGGGTQKLSTQSSGPKDFYLDWLSTHPQAAPSADSAQ